MSPLQLPEDALRDLKSPFEASQLMFSTVGNLILWSTGGLQIVCKYHFQDELILTPAR